jgi:hypothetical protein
MTGVRSPIATLNEPVERLDEHRQSLRIICSMFSGFLRLLQAYINFESLPKEILRQAGAENVPHSSGFLQQGLTPNKTVPSTMIQAWMKDDEHGFVHGISVAFFAVLFASKRRFNLNGNNEKLIISGLLHDFLRCSGIHEGHDEQLQAWYPNLLPITYTHSRPTRDQIQHPLIIGDRLELLRYHDHADWIDESVINVYLDNDEVCGIVVAYYLFIRPALARLFKYRDEPWLRHSVESNEVIATANIPGDPLQGVAESSAPGLFPRHYWAPYTGYWCVETGTLPFHYNIIRNQKLYHPFPVINLSHYLNLGGLPLRPVRDHLAASGKIPASEWLILLDDNDLEDAAHHDLLVESGGFLPLSLVNTMVELADYLLAFSLAASKRSE